MAIHKSALKKHKRDEKKRVTNTMHRSKMRNQIKLLKNNIDSGKLDEVKKMFPEVISIIDQTVSKGTIHKKTGSRYKSRLSHLIRKAGVEM